MKTFSYVYRFLSPDGTRSDSFELVFADSTLELLDDLPRPLPPWARLPFRQCANCPLEPGGSPHCPAAARLARLVAFCESLASYEKIVVEVAARRRAISACVSAQEGVSSIMGLIIAASGCPRAEFFRPLVRFHRPFANEEETLFSATSAYLLLQYFRRQRKLPADLEIRGLEEIYREMHKVNIGLADRLRAAVGKDSSVNALIVLDTVANMPPDGLAEPLNEMSAFFEPLLHNGTGARAAGAPRQT